MPLLPVWSRFRASEWVLLGFFGYVAILVPFFPNRTRLGNQPVFLLAGVLILFCCFSLAEQGRLARNVNRIRDWIPLGLILVAFREMELFVPSHYDLSYEAAWIRWDRLLLYNWHLRALVESLGPVIPVYLELSYLFVYGIGAYCVLILWFTNGRKGIDSFYVLYLLGTLTAYALFPYFPSLPPRIAFPQIAPPDIITPVRTLNLVLLNGLTIHSGVFPSAHVSSAFSASWAMFLLLPGRKRVGWGLFLYAVSVSIATIYGRYHYTADVLSGIAVSLVPALVAVCMRVGWPFAGRAAVAAAETESRIE
ncbi:MAG: phosphatase PAP2 family protein [Acidobacteriaceae bacterium]|nr:phosphatase PAP2 family protein [Acidobacteriaceae bacterium]MBV8573228.1 phosphatase PAP2 family protein [Acidobacteriaceae bacterium]